MSVSEWLRDRHSSSGLLPASATARTLYPEERLEMVCGSGNVFRDLSRNNADVEQFKAILAAEIIKALDRERLTVRAAHARTGIAAADSLASAIQISDISRLTD